MTKGSSKSAYAPPKTLSTVGYASHAPMKTTAVSYNTGKGSGGGERSYEKVSRYSSYGDKQTGSYQRETTKEKASTGEFYWKNGTSGVKNEFKKSYTERFGNKQGYTEVYKEERFRDVRYDSKSSDYGVYDGGKNVTSYDYGHYGAVSGGYDSYGNETAERDSDEECGGYGGYDPDEYSD